MRSSSNGNAYANIPHFQCLGFAWNVNLGRDVVLPQARSSRAVGPWDGVPDFLADGGEDDGHAQDSGGGGADTGGGVVLEVFDGADAIS
jgi:hypothetical protein